MRAPDFWRRRTVTPFLLLPVAALYRLVSQLRWALVKPWRAPVKVVCIGNLVAGGAGKTPLALAVAGRIALQGKSVHFLSRGYGGRERGPLRVDPERHGYRDVGDEPLLLAALAPTWVARDRRAGARAAAEAGAEIIVMDDGFQNPQLEKDLSILAIDGGYGFGNGLLLPAGPLREPVRAGCSRAQAAVLIGKDGFEARDALPPDLPVIRARFAPGPEAELLIGQPVVAFAGIGRPDKFFDTVRNAGADLVEAVPFPDHHKYTEDEVMWLVEMAAVVGTKPVTTMKDFVRLPETARPMVQTLSAELEFADENAIRDLLAGL